jgi:hypothetical protein
MSFIEQRTSNRIFLEAPVIVEHCQTEEVFDGSMYNHSEGGMYIELDHALEPGTEIRIIMDRAKASSQADSCRGKIVWCHEIPGAVVLYNYGIGVQYDSIIHTAECKKNFRVIEGGAA